MKPGDDAYPAPSSEAVSERMRRNRRRDTSVEVAVRRQLHAMGLRFRVDLPLRAASRVIRPDIVFPRARLAVFIDGCFWHRCPDHGNTPRTNADYWGPKLDRNVERDAEVNVALRDGGWLVMRAWEHEDAKVVAARIRDAYRRRLSF